MKRENIARHLPNLCLAIYVATVTIGAFTGGIWASFGIGLALLMFAGAWCVEGRAPWPERRIFFFTLAFFAICTALDLRSSIAAASWQKEIQLVSIFLPLSLLSNSGIQKNAVSATLFRILPYAALIGLAALDIEFALNGPLLHWVKGIDEPMVTYNRGFSYVVLLAFPILACLWISKTRWFLLLLFMLVLCGGAFFTQSSTAKLALMLGLFVMAVGYIAPVVVSRCLMILPPIAAFTSLASHWMLAHSYDRVEGLHRSWSHRVEIWDYMWVHIRERLVLGWGLGTSGRLPFTPSAQYQHLLAPPPHPHNAFVQLWVELGLPGLAIGILFGLYTLYRIGKMERRFIPFALGAWMAGSCLSLIAYDFWTDSLWAAFALTALLFALLQKQAGSAGKPC